MRTIACLALGGALFFATPAAEAATYLVSGTFLSQSGSDWQLFSGGSFSGSFTIADNFFPRGADTYAYLYNAPFTVTMKNAAGAVVETLTNTSTPKEYLEIASTYSQNYGGQRIIFYNSPTDYLQMVVAIDFTGTGSILAKAANYAQAGSNYATLSSGTVTRLTAAVPEPATWSLMLAGFGLVGYALRRKRTTRASAAA